MDAILFKKLVNVVTLLSFFMWNLAVAAPVGGSVAGGSATISQTPNGSLTTINQASQNTVINWQGFDTTKGQTVNFVQPNASAVALNRINSGLPTSFAGTLTANGQVWIVNPNGVLFTGSSSVNVAGLLATTHNITDANFMAGHYQFTLDNPNSTATVINNGSITVADTGMVALVAPGVENNGIITANLGKVTLASGSSYVLDLYGDQLINFGNSAPVQNGYVSNAGKIVANGGKVYLTANSAAKAVENVINMSGVIQATTASNGAHGTIILNGGHHGKVKVSGKLIATDGGYIETSGETLDIAQGAVNAGKGGKWVVDPPTTIIIDTNPLNGDWVDQIQNTISGGSDFSLGADTILVMEAISAEGTCGSACFPTLTLTANSLLDVLADISLAFANLSLHSDGILQTSALATLSVFDGNINLYGATLAEIDGPISSMFGLLTVTGQSDIILGDVTATYGAILIQSYGGNVTLMGNMDLTNQDYVEIYANQNLTLNGSGSITTNNAYLDMEAGYQNNAFGDLTLNGEINATDNTVYLSASNNVYIEAPVTVTNGNLDVYANGWDVGNVSVDAAIMVTSGNVYLWAYNSVEVNDSVTVDTSGGFEAIAVYGDVDVYAPIIASDYIDLFAYYDIYVNDGVALTVVNGNYDTALDIEGGYCYWDCSYSGRVDINGPISVMNGDVYIYAPDHISSNSTIDVTNGGVEMDTDNYSIFVEGAVTITGTDNAYFNAYAGGSVHLDAPVSVTNTDGFFDFGDYAIDVEAGQNYNWGSVYVESPVALDGGDAYLYARHNIYVDDMITVANGGLEISTGFRGGSVYIEAPITVDNYLDIYPDSNLYLDAPVTVNFGGLYIEAGWNVYLNAPIVANDDSYIYGSTVHVNAGITIIDGSLEFETSDGGPIYINTTDPIVSDWNMYFDNRVLLQSDATVTSNFGNIFFYSTVDSGWDQEFPGSLTVNVMSLDSAVYFWQNVGDNNPLNSLTVNGETRFSGYDIITFLSQIYNGQLTIVVIDPLFSTIETGGLFFNGGLFAPNSDVILISGSNSDFVGGGIFGSVNVLSLILGGTGGSMLTDSIVGGLPGLDAWQGVTLNTSTDFADTLSGLYCVNGGLDGACAPVIPPPVPFTPTVPLTPPVTFTPDQTVDPSTQIFILPDGFVVDPSTGGVDVTITNPDGNCDRSGCHPVVFDITKHGHGHH